MYLCDGRSTYIYVLCEPDGETVRYVGKTVEPEQRYWDHLKVPQNRHRTHKENWVAKLLANGQRPIMRIIDTIEPGGDWAEAERRWVVYYRDLGCDLTNITEGGEGVPGLVMTEEARLKMSVAKRGRKHVGPKVRRKRGYHLSDEHRRKIGDSQRGKTVSEESRRLVREASIERFDERLPDGWTTKMYEDLFVSTYETGLSLQQTQESVKSVLGVTMSFYRAKELLTERGVLREPKRSSTFLGVSWDKSRSKWTAKVTVNKKTINLGRFTNEEDAARRYDEAALLHFGTNAKLNFPLQSEVSGNVK